MRSSLILIVLCCSYLKVSCEAKPSKTKRVAKPIVFSYSQATKDPGSVWAGTISPEPARTDDPEEEPVIEETVYNEREVERGGSAEDEANYKGEKQGGIEEYHSKKQKGRYSDPGAGEKKLQQPKYFSYSDDQKHSASDTQDHGGKPHNEKYAKGAGQEHHSDHKSAAGGKGEKSYKGYHKYDKGKKGHHDKEEHKGKYSDAKGKKGKKKESEGHYGEHHHAEKGKKAAKYGESGQHKKGHSTKGEHNIHKKDEYLKKHEFYDEHHEGGEHEKHGGYRGEHKHKKGGKKKKGHHKAAYKKDHHGKKGHHEKGAHNEDHKGHKDASGHEGHYAHHKKYGKKGGGKAGKKWSYSKGKKN